MSHESVEKINIETNVTFKIHVDSDYHGTRASFSLKDNDFNTRVRAIND